MTIPRYDEIMRHALVFLKDGNERRAKELEKPLAGEFQLTEQELGQMYESGYGPVFLDRIFWALSHLYMTGLATRPKRGLYKISERGLELAATPDEIKQYVKIKIAERDAKKKKKGSAAAITAQASDLTPQELLDEAYGKIRRSSYDDIVDAILSKSPRAFEHLVLKLLKRMGYGGEVEGSGKVTAASHDEGIDGVIKEDVLGLGRIHIQAKRYNRKNTVGRDEIQKFVGALAVAQSNKGVFITTSSYTPAAMEYARSLHGSTTLVLIDGQRLAQYMYDYNLGVQPEQTIEIKKMDNDFWDSMQDAQDG